VYLCAILGRLLAGVETEVTQTGWNFDI